MRRAILSTLFVALFALHQDTWLFRESRPLALGFLPPGLWYHALYTIAVAAFLALLVKWAWPSHLEDLRD